VQVEDRDIFNKTAVGRGNDRASNIILKAKITNTSSVTGIGFLSLAIEFTVN
jgi:hypothetical protein